ncbi:MAG: TIGR03621 family F420-dependent LLM class oxidoreductase [Actinobacteria bacterium]|nr:TIGR03621 family F420-dependent LLM class oxidoreductase [Actinomycetota bacterium]
MNPHGAADAADWSAMARKAEDLGYATLLVPDHLNPQFAPFTALTAAALATSTLRVGTQVLCNEFRHPVVTAKEVATLDLVSGGRFEWGMGAGWVPEDFAAAGIDTPKGTRVTKLIEAVTIMKALFAGDDVDHVGAHYTVRTGAASPLPVQRPHPPLIIGGAKERILTFAGAAADIVSISPGLAARAFGEYEAGMSVEDNTTQQVEWVRSGAGDRFDEVELSVVAMPVRITDRPRDAAEEVAPNFGLTPDEALRSVHLLLGSVEEICDLLEARRARWGISNVVVPWHFADAFAPVVARLAGS